uniref:Tripartite motif-containing protein 35-like n=1 Tax=Scleropages formosus TaxID=113540 RepID=A0A8C9R8L5_SCLFO
MLSATEFICSVCCEIFKDPVVLRCSHSFCRSCVQQYWEQKNSRECPVCRRRSSIENPPPNLVLKNIVETYLKKRSEAEPVEESEARCSVHGEKLLLFCVEDQEPICLVCHLSKNHRNHQFCPVEEAAGDMKVFYSTFQVKSDTERYSFCDCNFQNQEFEKLHQFLRDEEEARLAALREEEEQKSQKMKEKIKNISKHVSILSDRIRDIEEHLNNEDTKFLVCEVQDPEVLSGALIDVAKHLGSLSFRVWEKMLHIVTYSEYWAPGRSPFICKTAVSEKQHQCWGHFVFFTFFTSFKLGFILFIIL